MAAVIGKSVTIGYLHVHLQMYGHANMNIATLNSEQGRMATGKSRVRGAVDIWWLAIAAQRSTAMTLARSFVPIDRSSIHRFIDPSIWKPIFCIVVMRRLSKMRTQLAAMRCDYHPHVIFRSRSVVELAAVGSRHCIIAAIVIIHDERHVAAWYSPAKQYPIIHYVSHTGNVYLPIRNGLGNPKENCAYCWWYRRALAGGVQVEWKQLS